MGGVFSGTASAGLGIVGEKNGKAAPKKTDLTEVLFLLR
jgi:hypothetical protein